MNISIIPPNNKFNRVCYDPVTLTILAATSIVGAAGASAYSASKESSAAKKAAEAQKAVGLAQVEAPLKAEQAAAETAQAKLKLKQASKTQTILTEPGALQSVADTTQKSILGV